MDKNQKVTNILITIVILIAIFVLPFVLASFIQKDREAYVSKGQKNCESRGGIYLSGGWGAANCVFPPKP